jgi:hypothetical protein
MYWRIKHSSVVPAFGRFGCPVITAVWSLILLDWAETETSFVKKNNKLKMKISLDRHSSQTNTQPLPSSLPTLFFVTTVTVPLVSLCSTCQREKV